MRFRRFTVLVILLFGSSTVVRAQDRSETGVEIKAREARSTVFGGERVKLHFDVASAEPKTFTVPWTLSAGRRRLAAGELSVDAGPLQAGTAALPLRIPEVRDGIVLDVELKLSAVVDGTAAAQISKRISIYPRDPFALRKKWLEELPISLYDPVGKTAKQFEEADVPFQQLQSIAALDSIDKGILVVGEGLSWKTQRGLFDTIVQAAARGLPVLCLASSEGAVPIPFAADSNLPRPDRVSLERNAVITRLDKRLDADAWGSGGDPVTTSLEIAQSRTAIEGTVLDSAAGWPWAELRYGDRGVLVWCGFGVISRWEDGPTPRYLLSRIFEYLSEQPPVSEESSRSSS